MKIDETIALNNDNNNNKSACEQSVTVIVFVSMTEQRIINSFYNNVIFICSEIDFYSDKTKRDNSST